jgi:hypothetical protein
LPESEFKEKILNKNDFTTSILFTKILEKKLDSITIEYNNITNKIQKIKIQIE